MSKLFTPKVFTTAILVSMLSLAGCSELDSEVASANTIDTINVQAVAIHKAAAALDTITNSNRSNVGFHHW